MRKLDLAGRTVLITGACGGLGTALSNALRSKGAKIAVLDLRQEAAAAEAERLGGGTQARGWAVDVRDLADLERVTAEAAAHFGGIDVVVAAAGVLGASATIDATDEEDWSRVVDVNLNGVWRTFKAASPHVAKRRGHMLAMSSMIAYVHPPLLGSYAASKAGVAALCDVTRLELRPQGVTVGSAHPVIFQTGMIGDALGSPAAVELVDDFTGVFKRAQLEDVVAEMVRGIERRSPRITVPRGHRATTFVPGLAQAALERLAFRPKQINRAIELGSVAPETTQG
ncbi:MAG: SDR family NAD(P)-dependent oxidoreductase [Solirubrobacterales bacterium]